MVYNRKTLIYGIFLLIILMVSVGAYILLRSWMANAIYGRNLFIALGDLFARQEAATVQEYKHLLDICCTLLGMAILSIAVFLITPINVKVSIISIVVFVVFIESGAGIYNFFLK